MNKMSYPPWTDVPQELLAAIAERLNAEPEILRFRGVCKSWRSSTTLKESSAFHLKLPFPISTKDPVNPLRKGFFTLSQTSTYLIQPLEQKAEAPYQSLLIRIQRGQRGKFFILNPFFRDRIIGFPPKTFPKLLNLLDYKVTEVGRSYSIKFNDRSKTKLPPINKIYRYPGNPQARKEAAAATVKRVVVSDHDQQQCLLFGIYNEGNLFSMRTCNKKWNTLDDGHKSKYEDVAIYKGKCYAVDHSGNVTVLNPSLKVLETIASPVASTSTPTVARHNHLVESFGDLLFISGDLDPPLELDPDDFRYVAFDNTTKTYRGRREDTHHTLRFQVYRLNEEKREWNQVTMEDRALFLGEDCRFSVMANDSAGCRRNCIYYDHNFIVDYWSYNHNTIRYNIEGLQCSQIGVYNLKDDIGGLIDCFKGFTDIFWPPPAWLRPNLPSTEEANLVDEDQLSHPSDLSTLLSLFKMEPKCHLFC